MVSLGGDTHGGRDWRSKLIPHVPRAETFQATPGSSSGRWEGGGVQLAGRAPRSAFPHFFFFFRPHTAVHTVPFSSTVASQGTIYFFWQALELHKLTASEKPKGLKIDMERATPARAAEGNKINSIDPEYG